MKARFFLYVCLIITALIAVVMAYTCFFQLNSVRVGLEPNYRIMLSVAVCFLIAACALALLVSGRFSLAAHLITIDVLATAWSVMAFERAHVLARLDTIVFSIGILAILPLVVNRRKSVIFLYGTLNFLFLLGFFCFHRAQLPIPDYLVLEYLADNTVAIVFICFLSFNILSINQKALDRANAEIEERKHAEATVQSQKESLEVINRELSSTLVRMEVTTREYEEANAQLMEAQSEILNANAQLRQAQKMESIGRLAGGVAHDFNNLLTAIMGNTSLAIMGIQPDNPMHPRLTAVMKAAESAAGLTGQLLAFSRKQIIEPRPIDLPRLIGKMHSMLARVIGEDIRLEIVSEQPRSFIKADPGQMEQILVNLVVNARDAMPEGGRLTVRTAGVALDGDYVTRHPYTTPGRYVMLSVSDTGMGIAPEVMPHLFEPFFTTKPVGKGTGLGLATVYGAVKQNGGFIEVDSEQGLGTAFTMYFPILEHESADPPEPVAGADLLSGTETILLVEDDPHVLDYALSILGHLGYTILPAVNGEEALIIAAGHPGIIDLLLTDVILPGMNGRALSDEIRLVRPGVRVLFTSGYTDDIIDHHGVLEAGIHFIGKPYSSEAIARKVREVLEKEAGPDTSGVPGGQVFLATGDANT